MAKSTWGGARLHPPGREGGRPKGKYPRRNLVIACTEDEYQIIIKAFSTRERVETLLDTINKSTVYAVRILKS